MICQNCNKRMANVHYTQIINGRKVEEYLCEQCAAEKGKFKQHPEIADISNFFAGFMGMPNINVYGPSRVQERTCEGCGMSFQQFQKTGKMGCEKCYELFGERIKPILKRIHGSTRHNGRVPMAVQRKLFTEGELNALRNELKIAISREEYERAAEIRDKIRELENRR